MLGMNQNQDIFQINDNMKTFVPIKEHVGSSNGCEHPGNHS